MMAQALEKEAISPPSVAYELCSFIVSIDRTILYTVRTPPDRVEGKTLIFLEKVHRVLDQNLEKEKIADVPD